MSELVVERFEPVRFGLAPAAEILLPGFTKPMRRKWEKLLMAGSKSFDLSKKTLDEYLGATTYAAVTPIFWGLWTSALDDTSHGGTAGEATYTSYDRVSVTNNTTNFPAATGTTVATKSNGTAITWPTSTGGSATITFIGVFTGNAKTSADLELFWFTVTSTAIANGDTPKINAAGFTATED